MLGHPQRHGGLAGAGIAGEGHVQGRRLGREPELACAPARSAAATAISRMRVFTGLSPISSRSSCSSTSSMPTARIPPAGRCLRRRGRRWCCSDMGQPFAWSVKERGSAGRFRLTLQVTARGVSWRRTHVRQLTGPAAGPGRFGRQMLVVLLARVTRSARLGTLWRSRGFRNGRCGRGLPGGRGGSRAHPSGG